MICGNTWAEKHRDTTTDAMEKAFFEAQENYWKCTKSILLTGAEVSGFTLAPYLYDKYQEFADLVDEDIDFMALYAEGGLTPKAREIIEQEAKVLASIIVG